MASIEIGSIAMQINRKAIKHLHISVLPPDGRVRVSAPETMSDTAIRMAVISRISWSRKQQSDFARQPRQSDREMISGESHYLWGRRYRLDVIERSGRHEVNTAPGKLRLWVQPGASVDQRRRALDAFYRHQLKERVQKLLPLWQDRAGVEVVDWGVKKMKTKWGSCNTQVRRIWLNLELAKKPPECLEYILVHELVHLLERNHNDRFRAHMDRLLPDWRERRDLLNRMPLAHNNWVY